MEEIYSKTLANGAILVNHTNIKSNINKYVMIFGKITSQNHDTIYLGTTEGENGPQVMIKGCSKRILSKYASFVGTAEADGSISYLDSFTEEMDNFDFLDNYNKLIDIYTTKKEIEPFI